MVEKRKAKRRKSDAVSEELNAIKRLLMLQLITSGVQAMDIAAALGVNKSVVSRLIPARKVKKRSAGR